MLLTITTTHYPATDLGFLLEKHPGKVHEFELSAGRATVFYCETTDERCTAALLLDVDPIGLVRSQAAKAGDAGLDQYVNDRPYVASSFLSVAIGTAFKSAMAGKSRSRPELMRNASEWLPEHPMKEWIAHRYFKHRRSLARVALEQLTREDSVETESDDAELPPPAASREMELEQRVSLNERRLEKVTELVAALGVKTIVDMGCGEGKLLSQLLAIKALDRVVGMDVSLRSLEHASERLHLDRMPPRQRARIELIHSSLVYTDQRLSGFGAATLTEVVEHLDPPRLSALERTVFEAARPTFIIVTTPNREYNVKFEGLNPGQFRHGDHRFEWTRSEFHGWCERQCDRFGYQVEYHPVGDEDPQIGPPTQLALFSAAARN